MNKPKLIDLIQYAQYLEFTYSKPGGDTERRWVTEIGRDLTKPLDDSLTINNTVGYKIPMDITSAIMLDRLEASVGSPTMHAALRKALNIFLPTENYLLKHELSYDDTLMLHVPAEDNAEGTLVKTEYALMFECQDTQYEPLIISGGSYGMLEALPLRSFDGWSVQAYRFDSLSVQVNSIINDNHFLKQTMTRVERPVPPSIFRNPNNWKVITLKTFSCVEKISPYVAYQNRQKD